MMDAAVILYRYDLHRYAILDNEMCDVCTGTSVKVELTEYEITKETPCGYWIKPKGFPWPSHKWMRKNAHRGFAHKTKDAALLSFAKRQEAHKGILESRLRDVNTALRRTTQMKGKANEHTTPLPLPTYPEL